MRAEGGARAGAGKPRPAPGAGLAAWDGPDLAVAVPGPCGAHRPQSAEAGADGGQQVVVDNLDDAVDCSQGKELPSVARFGLL